MTVCKNNIEELIALYSTDEITANEKNKVDAHIKECNTCSDELEIYKLIEQELDLDNYKAPSSFHTDLMEGLTHHKHYAKYTRYQPYISIAAAIVFVVFLSIIGLMNPNLQKDVSDQATMNTQIMDGAVTEEADTSDTVTEEAIIDDSAVQRDNGQADSSDMGIFEAETNETEGIQMDEEVQESQVSEAAPRMKMKAQLQEDVEKEPSSYRNEIIIGLIIFVLFSIVFIYRRTKKR